MNQFYNWYIAFGSTCGIIALILVTLDMNLP
jgi:hypothetical protein